MIMLRSATLDDKAFVDNLVFMTMHRYVEATWPSDLDAHRHYYEINKFDPTNTQIVELDEKEVGRISCTVYPNHIFIYELHVLPEYQRQGIGRQAIEGVFREAELRKLPVRATVLVVNQASRELCLSMGFEIIGVRDHRLQIQYCPKSCTLPMTQ